MTNTSSIVLFKRVGVKGKQPRKLITTTKSYIDKISLLKYKNMGNQISTEDFEKPNFDTKFEQVQTKFLKFVLNINKFASNHGLRAELGRFPLSICTDLKTVKYWHRLENMTMSNDSNSIYTIVSSFYCM